MKKPGQLRRSRPLPRGSGPRPTRLPTGNRARKAANLLRAHGEPAFRAWIRSSPSVVSGRGPCENVHVCTGGMSRKADARFVIPLTTAEHRELHTIGVKSFQAKYGIDLMRAAETVHATWEART